jgi:hypothetical protein
VVTAMDDHDALRAAYDKARAESCEILERLERAAADIDGNLHRSSVTVEARDDDDDALIAWSRNMPPKSNKLLDLPSQPERRERRASHEKLTDSESQRWQNYIDGKIAKAYAELDGKISARDKYWREIAKPGLEHAFATIINELRDQLRGDFAAKIEKLDLRLSALLADLSKRQTVIEAAERADAKRAGAGVVPLKFFGRRRHA